MTGYRRATIWILITSCFLAGCGSSIPPASTEYEAPLEGDSNRFIDWAAEDWKFVLPFTPIAYPQSFKFNSVKHETPYQDFTHYRPQIEPLSLDEFRQLPRATQNKRRLAAQETLYNAMAFNRIMTWSWEIWQRSLDSQVAKEAWFYNYGIITPAIMNFEQAAGEDPSNPYTWYHLAFFTGLVGNTTRQEQALAVGIEILAELENQQLEQSPGISKDLHLMKLRMLLDQAWLMRDKARFTEGMQSIRSAITLMKNDEYKTRDQSREARLLQALLFVDQGLYAEAQTLANQFEKWDLPFQRSPGGSLIVSKHQLDHVKSDFCRQWVWDMCHLKLGNKSRALRLPGRKVGLIEYPAHLGYRYWQDMGRIREHFGQKEHAASLYFKGFIGRPFLSFYPTMITTGYTPIFGQYETGNFHFLGYRDFFVGGSEFAYASAQITRMENAFGKKQLEKSGKEAIEFFTICINKGIRPLSSLALRGYAHTLLGQPALAEIDLWEADRLFTEAERDDPHVVHMLATLCYNRQAYDVSHGLLRRYLEMNPADGHAWRFDGVVLAEMGQYKEALDVLNHALELEPHSAPGLYNRALVLLHLGKVKMAQDDLRMASKISPGNNEIVRLSQLIMEDPLANVEFQHRKRKWSISSSDSTAAEFNNPAAGLKGPELLALIEKSESNYLEKPSQESLHLLGLALHENHQWTDVQKLMAPLWPDKINMHNSLLLLQADRALGTSIRAVELAQTLTDETTLVANPELWTLVAVICHESGKLDSGNMALELALELDPENRALLMMQGQVGHY